MAKESPISAISLAPSVKKLFGHFCWNVDWWRLLNLSMDFGKPRLRLGRIRERKIRSIRGTVRTRGVTYRGQWFLWIYLSYWSILLNDTPIASYSSLPQKQKKALAILEGQKIKNIWIDRESGATRFEFDLGAVLQVRRRARRSRDELWLLYMPNGYVLSILGNGSYTYEPGSGIDKRKGVSGALRDV
jgi:hypothetical protein